VAAFVVVVPDAPSGTSRTGVRLNIFPGSATPAVFSADAPFWIGYGFVSEAGKSDEEAGATLGPETRFELAVDDQRVSLVTDVEVEEGRTIQKLSGANFPVGLPAGWHRFAARWYVAGKLVLTNDRSIEFVER